MKESGFSEKHLDVLKEIANIGAGHAATALSQLLNKPMDMNVPSVEFVPFEEMNDRLGEEEAVVAAAFLHVNGDAPGSLFFILPAEDATTLVQELTLNEEDTLHTPPYSDMAVSAFNEVGNILAGSYLSALTAFTDLKLYPSPPQTAVDLAMAIVSHGLIAHSEHSDYALVIDTKISEKSHVPIKGINGHFFFLPNPESFKPLLHSLGVQLDG
ncbi:MULTISPECIES: chemotaxis protein CheC [Alteribacter]|uniref:Chemotaxis protein CheC n=1 Tax=Alteribacter keqinensis TaxID=2483800 RepID=A0A3M7TXE3_9BACI|nr:MULTISPECIES: chemotaxis protein CheC [Alteribacter]MBM7094196.1 chemotaxis protein CheC [Alteribacter salitolerans]RNA69572.1 chemotaxis protein CheC [Alteribacter keqinensis]